MIFLRPLAALCLLVLLAAPAHAAQCGGSFPAFLAAIAREAQAAGISRAVIDSAFAGVTQDHNVPAFDRRQRGTFRKSFEEYAETRVTPGRISRGRQLLTRHAGLLSRVERQFGVPPRYFAPVRRICLIRLGGTPDFAAIALSCSLMMACAGSSPSRPPSTSIGTRRLERCVPSS